MVQQKPSRLQIRRNKKKQEQRKGLRLLIMANTVLLTVGLLIVACIYLPEKIDNFFSSQNGASTDSTKPTPDNVRLTFAGDIMMSGHVETLLKDKGYDHAFTHVKDIFLADDYTIGNLETPITEKGTPAANKQFVYRSSPEAVTAMKKSGIDLVNLANNHSMDQGEDGLLDTMYTLDKEKIAYVGAGVNADRAYSPVFVERNGIKMAFFGFSRVVPEISWYAGKNKTGLAVMYDPKRAAEAVQAAKKEADLVIVIAHWGKEKVDFPVEHQKELAKALVSAGADLIVGGHPHVLQGFEQLDGKWIAYSMGNFIFTRATQPKTWETMLLQATLTKEGVKELKMIPYHAELGQAVPMNEENSRQLIKRIESISSGVTIAEDGTITASEERAKTMNNQSE
ncbi:CapA family protein [Brevibacillus laterosporus]|uniref:Capsule biosynthesis protein n=2 Tax=Brevibacillus TaxID=55080 RepID=A0A0F6XYX7_BRELA|nr:MULTISPECIES: CapA family protein [Brevibacillus]AKF92796.1 capsule biosynthesis protein [Brevibacillus laterosporus]MCR8987794.1 CapA family protein [Brevibacillus laterosporus]MCZ0833533.1 CapA family protein [Brevibacillus halotolerans]